jgi:hypothetical protein
MVPEPLDRAWDKYVLMEKLCVATFTKLTYRKHDHRFPAFVTSFAVNAMLVCGEQAYRIGSEGPVTGTGPT